MNTYYIDYKINCDDDVRSIKVEARNRIVAYNKAISEDIPKIEGKQPYSAWVASVVYRSGRHLMFNTFEGNPY